MQKLIFVMASKLTFIITTNNGWTSTSVKITMALAESDGKARYRDAITSRTISGNGTMYYTSGKYNGIDLKNMCDDEKS